MKHALIKSLIAWLTSFLAPKGSPSVPPNTIPTFSSFEEEVAFWKLHEYEEFSQPNKSEDEPKEERVTIRLEPSLKHTIEVVAQRYNISVSEFVRISVIGKLQQLSDEGYVKKN